jgi:hypothetical protein
LPLLRKYLPLPLVKGKGIKGIGLYKYKNGSLRGRSPLLKNTFPLSFKGEGDTGGEVEKTPH